MTGLEPNRMTNTEDQKPDEANVEDQPSLDDITQELLTDDVPEAEDAKSTQDREIDTLSFDEMRAETIRAREEADKFRDAALRAEAEMQNVRRRSEREVEHAVKYGVEKIVQNLLPVVDSLEKAVEAAEQTGADNDATQAIIEGVGLCQRLFLEVIVKAGVVTVDPHGEPFDPNLHQAISMVENPDVEPNSVVAVVQKGYSLNGRLVRPAMVMVAKGKAKSIDEKA
ncbi:MAG: molecular chaperone GrpE [Candidatus Pseudothioglobus sp.]|jgi:molecular chaperone GrpE